MGNQKRLVIEKKLFVTLALYAILLISLGVFITGGDVSGRYIFILFTFYVNIAISFVKLMQSVRKNNYSLDMMFWMFGLFFFGFAPLVQFQMQRYAWGLLPTKLEIVQTNMYITLWYICYLFGGKARFRFSVKRRENTSQVHSRFIISKNALRCLLCASVLMTAYFVIRDGTQLIIRGIGDESDMSKGMGLIIHHGFRNIILFTMALSCLQAKQRRKVSFELVVSCLCLMVSCFPTGLSRYMIASFYGGIMVLLFAQKGPRRWVSFAIIGGLVFLFPLMNIFRNMHTLQSVDSLAYIQSTIRETYLEGHYDAHQMFISVRRWGEMEGITFGRQLLGAVLFFVPRSIWKDKPYGTGQTAFEKTRQSLYTNVSSPLVSEAWINFGIVGIVVFGLIVGYIVRRLDRKYWSEKDELSCIRVVYPFSMFMFFFFQRGDMMATGSYTFAQVFVGVLVYKFAVKRIPDKMK